MPPPVCALLCALSSSANARACRSLLNAPLLAVWTRLTARDLWGSGGAFISDAGRWAWREGGSKGRIGGRWYLQSRHWSFWHVCSITAWCHHLQHFYWTGTEREWRCSHSALEMWGCASFLCHFWCPKDISVGSELFGSHILLRLRYLFYSQAYWSSLV